MMPSDNPRLVALCVRRPDQTIEEWDAQLSSLKAQSVARRPQDRAIDFCKVDANLTLQPWSQTWAAVTSSVYLAEAKAFASMPIFENSAIDALQQKACEVLKNHVIDTEVFQINEQELSYLALAKNVLRSESLMLLEEINQAPCIFTKHGVAIRFNSRPSSGIDYMRARLCARACFESPELGGQYSGDKLLHILRHELG